MSTETTPRVPTYNDDRYGHMRIHIADDRARYACGRWSRNALRSFAKGHGLKLGSLRKHDMAWQMAQHGLLDADGFLRDGFPQPPTQESSDD